MATRTKKSTTINVVESDQIVQHILPLTALDTRTGINAADRKYTASSFVKNQSYANSDTSSDEESYRQTDKIGLPDVHNDESDSLIGKDIFQFKTLKKSGQMALKAQDSCSPSRTKTKQECTVMSPQRIPKILCKKGLTPPSTPKSNKKALDSANELTPKQVSRNTTLRDRKRMESSTPYRLRKRNLHLEHAGKFLFVSRKRAVPVTEVMFPVKDMLPTRKGSVFGD